MYKILYETQVMYEGPVPTAAGQRSPLSYGLVLRADDREDPADSVEARFAFISDKAEFASEDLLDV